MKRLLTILCCVLLIEVFMTMATLAAAEATCTHPLSAWSRVYDNASHWTICSLCGTVIYQPESHWELCGSPGTCGECGAQGVLCAYVDHPWEFARDKQYHWTVCYECGIQLSEPEVHFAYCDEGNTSSCAGCMSYGLTIGRIVHFDRNYFPYSATQHQMICSTCGAVEYEDHVPLDEQSNECILCGAVIGSTAPEDDPSTSPTTGPNQEFATPTPTAAPSNQPASTPMVPTATPRPTMPVAPTREPTTMPVAPTQKPTTKPDETTQYLITDSDVRELTREELWTWDYESLLYIYNEIFARHGYNFEKGGPFDNYFRCMPWYTPNADSDNQRACYPQLTEVEWKNIELIREVRAEMRSQGTQNKEGKSIWDTLVWVGSEKNK